MFAQRRMVSLAAERRGRARQVVLTSCLPGLLVVGTTGVSPQPTMIITGRFCSAPRAQVPGLAIKALGCRRGGGVVSRGPVPKVIRSRQRATAAREAEMTDVADTGRLAGFPLPEGVLPDGEAWHPQTLALWDSLRRYPPLADEPDLSWQYLVDTAVLHHAMWQHGHWQHAAEVRLRLAKVAATPEDRLRLKVRLAAPATLELPSDGSVSDIASRRARLTT
jgi:hypothetical protein